MSGEAPKRLEEALRRSKVLVCAGPGGVGKTTCAAALALAASKLGRRVCVVTIDPARRLADALGVDLIGNEPTQVKGAGDLWALMLDTKSTFDEVVRRNARTPEQAEAILANTLYRNISAALGGTQEYMAMEKLHELHTSGRFDLIVVDTPPTRHALDFLDAPTRLVRFLDNKVFRLVTAPTRASLRAVGLAAQLLLRTLSKVVGGAVVSDAVAFFTAFEGMEQGFRDRAARVRSLLEGDQTTFVVVSAPRAEAIDEAIFFVRRLEGSSKNVGAVVANRVFPTFGVTASQLEPFLASGVGSPTPDLEALVSNLANLQAVSAKEAVLLERLEDAMPSIPVLKVALMEIDIHDLEGLEQVGRALVDPPGQAF